MAELTISSSEEIGIKKEIDEGAYGLVFQAIQQDMYSFPIPSFIRETVSNSLDAHKEREIVFNILKGDPVEKYYLQRQDDKLLKDSQFDSSYYNPDFLQKHHKHVLVTYTNKNTNRDLIEIEDYGVGLGKERLRGFFKLGYSSKRNMKDVIGKWGAGSKSALATGVDYFLVTTYYNGYSTSFMVYNNDYEPITPKHINGKTEVWKVTMANNDVKDLNIHWEPTDRVNGVKIGLEVKKHNKDQFITALYDQFQYFTDKIKFKEVGGSNPKEEVISTEHFYNSDTFAIPKSSTYRTPHVLVDNISYGPVSWQELELERRLGRVAIKVTASEVDITQSRESLKWTEKTKKTILQRIEDVKNEAGAVVSEKTKVDEQNNIFEFIDKHFSTVYRDNDSAVFIMSEFLDKYNIVPTYKVRVEEETEIATPLGPMAFTELFYRFNIKKITARYTKHEVEYKSSAVNSFRDMINNKIVFAENTTLGPKRSEYIINNLIDDQDSFIYIRPKTDNDSEHVRSYGKLYDSEKKRMVDCKVSFVQKEMYNKILSYNDINIDEINWDEINLHETKEVSENGNVISASKESLATLRRKNKQIYYRTASISSGYRKLDSTLKGHTIKIADIDNHFDVNKTIVICTHEYRHLGIMLDMFHHDYCDIPSNIQVVYVAKDVAPLLIDKGIFITEYIRKFNPKNNTLMVGDSIKKMNTARIIKNLYKNHSEVISKDLLTTLSKVDSAEFFKYTFNSTNSNTIEESIEDSWKMSSELKDDILGYLQGLENFQKILRTGDAVKIANASQELFGTDKVHHLDSYDEDLVEEVQAYLKKIEKVYPLCKDLESCSEETAQLIEKLINYLKIENNDNI